jgi:hypothetical protein
MSTPGSSNTGATARSVATSRSRNATAPVYRERSAPSVGPPDHFGPEDGEGSGELKVHAHGERLCSLLLALLAAQDQLVSGSG